MACCWVSEELCCACAKTDPGYQLKQILMTVQPGHKDRELFFDVIGKTAEYLKARCALMVLYATMNGVVDENLRETRERIENAGKWDALKHLWTALEICNESLREKYNGKLRIGPSVSSKEDYLQKTDQWALSLATGLMLKGIG